MDENLGLNEIVQAQILGNRKRTHLHEEFEKVSANMMALGKSAIGLIKNGGTTGNLIRDAVIVARGYPDQEVESALGRIQNGISGRTGEPVLRVVRARFDVVCGYDRGSFEQAVMSLSVLSGDTLELDIQGGRCHLPSPREASSLSSCRILHVCVSNSSPELISLICPSTKGRIIILIGMERILEWARSEGKGEKTFAAIYLMATEIGLTLPEIPELSPELIRELDSSITASHNKPSGNEIDRLSKRMISAEDWVDGEGPSGSYSLAEDVSGDASIANQTMYLQGLVAEMLMSDDV